MIDNNSVEFFKITAPSLKLSSVKVYQLNIGHYWYSSTEAILLVSLSPPKLGQFCTFFLNQNKGSKQFNGPRFNLDLAPCVTDKWTTSPPNLSSLTRISETSEQNSPHSIAILTIYGTSYLLHIQCLSGILKIFKLIYEKTEEIRKIQLHPGQFGIRLVDNLILMQNYTLQETYVIDINSESYATKPFCMFWNSMKEALPTVNIKIKVFIQKPRVVAQATFLYDSKPIHDLGSFAGIDSLGGEALECAMPLNPSLIYTDKDICVDTKSGRCYKLQFSPQIVVKNHPNHIESALFLFRRTGCKVQAYDFLKDCIRKYTHIKEFSYFFNTVNTNYKNNMVEKKAPPSRKSVSLSKSDLYTRRFSSNMEPELKVEEGVVVLYQTDVFSILFQVLAEEDMVRTDYLASVLQEYIRSLVELDIEVQSSLQLLLARLLIKAGDLLGLQNLVMYTAFTDSYEMVNLLVGLIPRFYNALQLSVDMLFRMRYHEKLIDIMLDRDFVYETLSLLAKVSYPRFDIRKLLGKCEEIGDEQMTSVVTQFIKEKSLS